MDKIYRMSYPQQTTLKVYLCEEIKKIVSNQQLTTLVPIYCKIKELVTYPQLNSLQVVDCKKIQDLKRNNIKTRSKDKIKEYYKTYKN